MIQAVIFDFDGVLLDSEPLWDETDEILLGKRGFKPTAKLFLERLGTGQSGTMEIYKSEFGMDVDSDAFIEERREIFNSLLGNNMNRLKLMDGAKSLLEVIKKKEIPMSIATG